MAATTVSLTTTILNGTTEVNTLGQTATIAVRAFTLVLISVLAIFGNTLVITAVAKYRKLRTSANVFVANLALVNATQGVLLVFMTWNVVIDGNALGDAGCTTWAFIMGSLILTSTLTMALVALNRYILIAHTRSYRVAFSTKKSALMSLGAWLCGVAVLLGTVLGWSEVRYNPRTKACSYSREANASYNYFALSVGFGIPFVVVTVSYSLLYYTVWRSKKRIAAQHQKSEKDDAKTGVSNAQDKQQTSHQPKNTEVKLTKMLVTIFLVYVGMLGPYTFINMIDSDGTRFPEVIHILTTWLGFANTSVNPFIYAFMNKNFRDGYIALLGNRCACARKRIEKAHLDTGESTVIVKNTV